MQMKQPGQASALASPAFATHMQITASGILLFSTIFAKDPRVHAVPIVTCGSRRLSCEAFRTPAEYVNRVSVCGVLSV